MSWKMKYFVPEEFRGWYDQIDLRLKMKLDKFRELWGASVIISPAPGAIGRRMGSEKNSQHNIDKHGHVMAVDIMPLGMDTAEDRNRALACAKEAGFTGIGIYPDWIPMPGLHIDVRIDRLPNDPALWSCYKNEDDEQEYFGIEKALKHETI